MQCNTLRFRVIHSTLRLQTSAIFGQSNSTVELVFNAIQGRIPARIPPIPEAITRGEFDWDGGGDRKEEENSKVGVKGKVKKKGEMKIIGLLAED